MTWERSHRRAYIGVIFGADAAVRAGSLLDRYGPFLGEAGRLGGVEAVGSIGVVGEGGGVVDGAQRRCRAPIQPTTTALDTVA